MVGLESMQAGKGRNDMRLFLGVFISVSVLLCCRVFPAMAHGTAAAVIEKRTVCIAFTYDDGEPIGYSKVTISAPESDLPFQSSATDRNGIVCFAPDKVGSSCRFLLTTRSIPSQLLQHHRLRPQVEIKSAVSLPG